ncbi:gem (nuclear organelle) associated protein 2 [Irineochytrium annulatum]|nr:gem (nuclear organelle) associated protein 2 [Irineochytrium annulatum]
MDDDDPAPDPPQPEPVHGDDDEDNIDVEALIAEELKQLPPDEETHAEGDDLDPYRADADAAGDSGGGSRFGTDRSVSVAGAGGERDEEVGSRFDLTSADYSLPEQDQNGGIESMESWSDLMKSLGERRPSGLQLQDEDEDGEGMEAQADDSGEPFDFTPIQTRPLSFAPGASVEGENRSSHHGSSRLLAGSEGTMALREGEGNGDAASEVSSVATTAKRVMKGASSYTASITGSYATVDNGSVNGVDSDASDDDFELPEELKREKELLDQRLKQLDQEHSSQSSLLNSLMDERSQMELRRPPAQKKKMEKPKIVSRAAASRDHDIDNIVLPPKAENPKLAIARQISQSLADELNGISRAASSAALTDDNNNLHRIGGGQDGSRMESEISLLRDPPPPTQGSDGGMVPEGQPMEKTMHGRASSVATDGYDEEHEELAQLERNLKMEHQSLQLALKAEADKQAPLALKIESVRSSMGNQRRALRATKMKVRELEDRCRQILHWLSVVAKVAFEKEKDRAHALLHKAMRLIEKYKSATEAGAARVGVMDGRLADQKRRHGEVAKELDHLRAEETELDRAVAALKADLEAESSQLAKKKDNKEYELRAKLQAEEAQRLFEVNLLKDNCEKQNPGKGGVDVEDLICYEAVDKNLTKIEDFSMIELLPNLLYLDLSKTHIGNGGIDCLAKCPVLQYLGIAGNGYSSIPDIHNVMLLVLNMQYNSIKRLNVMSWLPRLRILRVDDNLIENVEPLSMCPFLREISIANNKINDVRDLYALAACQELEVLDISGNPIIHHRDFFTTVCALFKELKVLNEINLNLYHKGMIPRKAKFKMHSPLKVAAIVKDCARYYKRQVMLSEEERQTVEEQWEEFKRNNQQQIQVLESFMGPFYEPYLAYLAGNPDTIFEGKLESQTSLENRIQWLTGMLQQYLMDVITLGKHLSPSSDMATVAIAEDLASTVDVWHVIYIQACARRYLARTDFLVQRGAAMYIQRWVRVILAREHQKRDVVQQAAALKIQSIFRGYRTRKLIKKLKQIKKEHREEFADLDDTSLLEWLSDMKEDAYEDSMIDYLKDEQLHHYNNIDPRAFRRQRRHSTKAFLNTYSGAKGEAGPHHNSVIEEDGPVEVNLVREENGEGWMNFKTNSTFRHEALPPLAQFDPMLVDFDPLRTYLAKRALAEEEEAQKRLEAVHTEKWNLATMKAQQALERKRQRDRQMLQMIHRRDAVNDPFQRLRNFYRRGYKNLLSDASSESDRDSNAPGRSPRQHSPAPSNTIYEWDVQTRESHERKLQNFFAYKNPRRLPEITSPKDTKAELMVEHLNVLMLVLTYLSQFQKMPFATSPGVTLLINNYLANKVTRKAETSIAGYWGILLTVTFEAEFMDTSLRYALPCFSLRENAVEGRCDLRTKRCTQACEKMDPDDRVRVVVVTSQGLCFSFLFFGGVGDNASALVCECGVHERLRAVGLAYEDLYFSYIYTTILYPTFDFVYRVTGRCGSPIFKGIALDPKTGIAPVCSMKTNKNDKALEDMIASITKEAEGCEDIAIAKNLDAFALLHRPQPHLEDIRSHYFNVKASERPPEVPPHLRADPHWLLEFLQQFAQLKQEVSERVKVMNRNRVGPAVPYLPPGKNWKAWKNICYPPAAEGSASSANLSVSTAPASDLTKGEVGMECNDAEEGELEDDSVEIDAVNQPEPMPLVWITARMSNSQWIFALLLRLETPLFPDDADILRSLCRKCQRIRSNLMAAGELPEDRGTARTDPRVLGLRMIVTIITGHFGQKDLADEVAERAPLVVNVSDGGLSDVMNATPMLGD